MPSGEVRITPLLPTATNKLLAKVSALALAPPVLVVHVTPSGEVATVELVVTATNLPAPNVTPKKLAVEKTTRCVHVVPSGEVWMRPLLPTATKRLLAKVTARSATAAELLLLRWIQVTA